MKKVRRVTLYAQVSAGVAEVLRSLDIEHELGDNGSAIVARPDAGLVDALRSGLEEVDASYRLIEEVDAVPERPFVLIDLEGLGERIGDVLDGIAKTLAEYCGEDEQVSMYDIDELPDGREHDGVLVVIDEKEVSGV